MNDDEILAIAADAQEAITSGHHFAAAEAADLLRFARHILGAQAASYAAANPLGGPTTIFEAIASRARAGEDHQAVMDDYGIRFAVPACRLPERRMIVCPDCGNKRCPRATDSARDCTGSNELGQ